MDVGGVGACAPEGELFLIVRPPRLGFRIQAPPHMRALDNGVRLKRAYPKGVHLSVF